MPLESMYRGDTRIFQMTADADLTGGHLYMIIKTKETDSDAQAIFGSPSGAEMTLGTLVNGVFSAVADADGHKHAAMIEIPATTSNTFPVATVWVGIEWVNSQGKNYTVLVDTMDVKLDLRRSVGVP